MHNTNKYAIQNKYAKQIYKTNIERGRNKVNATQGKTKTILIFDEDFNAKQFKEMKNKRKK